MASSSSGDRLPRKAFRVAGFLMLLLVSTSADLVLSPAAAKQAVFATPEQAVDGLVAAVRAGKAEDVQTILGPGSSQLLKSGDPAPDAQARPKFVEAYDEGKEITQEA